MSVIQLGLLPLTTADSITSAGGVIRLVNDSASPGFNFYYGTNSLGTRGWYSLSSEGVNDIIGTANQVLANGTSGSAQTGSVTLTLATALASINSITAESATNLTLTGGSSGASLVLGQGTSGAGTISVTGTSGAAASALTLRTSFATTSSATRLAFDNATNANLGIVEGGTENGSTSGYVAIRTRSGGSTNEVTRATSSQNLLIGGTTDFSSGSGQLWAYGNQLRVGSAPNTIGGPTKYISVGTTTLSDVIGVQLSNADGTNNLRAGMNLDAANERVVWDYTYSSGSSVRYSWRRVQTPQMELTFAGNLLIGGTTDITGSGGLKVFGTTAATSTTSGALQVAGGVGVQGSIFAGGKFAVDTSTSFATLSATGARLEANTTWGGVLAGYGTTNDVSIFNKSGALALSVPTGTTNIGVAGNLTVSGTGTSTFAGEVRVDNAVPIVSVNRTSGTDSPRFTFQSGGSGIGIIAVAGAANAIVAGSSANDMVMRTNSGSAFRITTDGGVNSALSVTQAVTAVAGNLTVSGTGTSTFAGQVELTKNSQGASPSTTAADYAIRLRAADTNTYANLIGLAEAGANPVTAAIVGVDTGTGGAQGLAFFTGNIAGGMARALYLDSAQGATFGGNVTATGTVSAGAGTSVFGGAISLTSTSANIFATTASTSQKFIWFQSTGGDAYFGIESSVGGGFFNGSNAYETVIYSPGDTVFINTPLVRASANLSLGGAADPFARGYGRALGVSSTGSAALSLNAATGQAAYVDVGVNSVRLGSFSGSATDVTIGSITALPLYLSTNNTARVTIAAADGAITLGSASSITAASATNLTLAGGSSGASLVLGQGANGDAVINVSSGVGTGLAKITRATAGGVRTFLRLDETGTAANSAQQILAYNTAQSWEQGAIRFTRDGAANDFHIDLVPSQNGTLNTTNIARLTDFGNLLIGGTTDITGSGGLKVFGTTASTSTTSGALQVAGGAGIAGALYVGGSVVATASGGYKIGSSAWNFAELSTGTLIFGGSAPSQITQIDTYVSNVLAQRVNSTSTVLFGNLTVSGTGSHQIGGTAAIVGVGGAANGAYGLRIYAPGSTYNTNFYSASASTSHYNTSLISGAMTAAVGYFGIGGSAVGNASFQDAFVVGTQSAHPLRFNTNDQQRVEISSSGNVSLSSNLSLTVGTAASTASRVTANGNRPVVLNGNNGRMEIKGDTGGWNMGIRFTGSSDTVLGGFWAGGAADALTSLNLGSGDFATSWLQLTSTLATFSGDLTVSGGNVGIGGAVNGGVAMYLRTASSGFDTSTSQYGLLSSCTFNSSATTAGVSGYFDIRTAASSFTMVDAIGVRVGAPTLGAGSSITTINGLAIANQGAAGVTHAYGIDIAAQSGAATTNVGLRNAGTTLFTYSSTSIGVSGSYTAQFLHAGTANLTIGTDGTSGLIQTWASKPLHLNSQGNSVNIGLASPSSSVAVLFTTAATSTTTGALQVAGGVGVAGAAFIGGAINAKGNAVNIGNNAGAGSELNFYSGTSNYWRLYQNNGDTNLYLRDMVNSFTLATFTTNTSGSFTWHGTGAFAVAGNLTVSGNSVGIGGGGSSDVGIYLRSTGLAGATQYGILSNPVFSSSATSFAYGGLFQVATAAASFTLGSGVGIRVTGPTLGAGSAITTQTGLLINNQGAVGVTNAYGIDIAAQSGAVTTNIGLRNAGTTRLTNSTNSTSTTTGALVVTGGAGFGGNITVGGSVSFANHSIYEFDSGRLRIDKSLVVGATTTAYPRLTLAGQGYLNPTNTPAGLSVSSSWYDYVNSGTVAAAHLSVFGGASSCFADNPVTYTDASTVYISSGPVAGSNVTITNNWGLWVAPNLRVDGIFRLTNTTTSTSTTTGALAVTGGAGFGGTVWALNMAVTSSTLTYAATVNLDFTSTSGLQTVTLTGNLTFGASSGLAAGRGKIVRLVGDGSSRTLSFPAGWKFIGGSAPTSLAANKVAVLSATAFGAADSDVVVAYAVEP